MKKKNILLLAMAILLVVVLTSCNNQREGVTTELSSAVGGNESLKDETVTAIISANPVEAFQGDENIEYIITITDNPGILGLLLSVSFDEEYLTLTDVDNGEAFSALNMTKPGVFNSDCCILWDGVEIDEEEIEDGTILTLHFTVSDNAPSGIYPITLSCIEGSAIDNMLKPISVQIKNEGITVKQK